jgi:flavin-dependent dehydrogenase
VVGTDSYDVLVVGGGVAGATCAYSIARTGRSVALVDHSRRPATLGESLPPAANQELQRLGLLKVFEHAGHSPSYGTTTAWGSNRIRHKDFIYESEGNGWHLDVARLRTLLREAAEQDDCELIHGRLISIERSAAGWLTGVTALGDDMHIRGAILIDATGRQRHVARLLGMKAETYDCLIAAVSNLRPKSGTVENRTYVEAVEWGWWYANPLPGEDKDIVLGFVTDSDIMRSLNASESKNWLDLLARTSHIRALIEEPASFSARISFVPAYSSRLRKPAGENWYAAGDAAGTYDPVSALGLTSALIASRGVTNALIAETTSAAYIDWFERHYASYLAHWVSVYDSERRWPNSIFWKRRHDIAQVLRG